MIENAIECPGTPLEMCRHFSEFCLHPPPKHGQLDPPLFVYNKDTPRRRRHAVEIVHPSGKNSPTLFEQTYNLAVWYVMLPTRLICNIQRDISGKASHALL